jgi:hypothetical protein
MVKSDPKPALLYGKYAIGTTLAREGETLADWNSGLSEGPWDFILCSGEGASWCKGLNQHRSHLSYVIFGPKIADSLDKVNVPLIFPVWTKGNKEIDSYLIAIGDL